MTSPFPSVRLEYTYSVSLNWSTHTKGTGRTPKEARAELMYEALYRLTEPQLRRVEAAWNEKEGI